MLQAVRRELKLKCAPTERSTWKSKEECKYFKVIEKKNFPTDPQILYETELVFYIFHFGTFLRNRKTMFLKLYLISP